MHVIPRPWTCWNCGRRHRTWRALADCLPGKPMHVGGQGGPFACISDYPGGRSVSLHPSHEQAETEKEVLGECGCSGRCRGRHRVEDLREYVFLTLNREEYTTPPTPDLRGVALRGCNVPDLVEHITAMLHVVELNAARLRPRESDADQRTSWRVKSHLLGIMMRCDSAVQELFDWDQAGGEQQS